MTTIEIVLLCVALVPVVLMAATLALVVVGGALAGLLSYFEEGTSIFERVFGSLMAIGFVAAIACLVLLETGGAK